jgi:hypothetical protein
LNSAEQNEGHKQYWCSVSYVPGWVDGWMGAKAVLRIAYSNQKDLIGF